ncbi:hypothetical protein PoB_004899200 [Plakobranchus ocellatus]|uniref:Uncharacterized protein n=1 Tax=Plakobranchus ocellatus TaxID=259542 RepID=A0AAV4BU21_9GAST|nr:hypothetical protein PoB_004899200 [Plakobranchus ocellatus]
MARKEETASETNLSTTPVHITVSTVRPGRHWRGSNPRQKDLCMYQGGFDIYPPRYKHRTTNLESFVSLIFSLGKEQKRPIGDTSTGGKRRTSTSVRGDPSVTHLQEGRGRHRHLSERRPISDTSTGGKRRTSTSVRGDPSVTHLQEKRGEHRHLSETTHRDTSTGGKRRTSTSVRDDPSVTHLQEGRGGHRHLSEATHQ